MSRSADTPLHTPAGTHTRATLAQASSLVMFAILAIVFAMTVSLVLYLGKGLDRDEQRQTQTLVQKSFVATQRVLNLTLKDYAFWGEAYRHLHTTVDVDWAFVRENFGAVLNESFGIQGVFVLGPGDQTRYSVINGQYQTVAAAHWIGHPIQEWLDTARAQAADDEVLTLLTTLHGTPTFVGAGAITPGTDPTVQRDGRAYSVMLLFEQLDPVTLDKIGQSLGLQGLRVAVPDDTSDPRLFLPAAHGEVIELQWHAARPGRQMIIFVLPMIVLAGFSIFLTTWVLLRRTERAARALDASHELLRGSQAALAMSESRFRDVAEASSDWIWEIDGEGRVTYLSDRFETVTGLSKQRWLGTLIDHLVEVESGTALQWLRDHEGAGHAACECRYIDADRRRRTARVAARAISGHGYRGTATDVTEEIEARQRVEYLSRHDVLTGLPNRSQLRDFLDGKLVPSLAASSPLVMLAIDLDRFKPVNDLLGHATGDRVLHQVAARIKQCVRAEDLVARVGGDEFVMVVSGSVHHPEVEAICRRLIDLIEQVIVIDGQDIFVSASIGIAMAPTDASQATELLRYSDIALYEAKTSGRGTWRFYDGEMNDRIIERRRLESDLRYAILHDELRLHFQPRFRVNDGKRVSAEALVRWEHPERGLLSPDAFVPMAEETGQVIALGDWVLNAACAQAIHWPEELFVSVNVSSREFQGEQLVERVRTALATSGLAAQRLELEVTESVMLEDAHHALEVMQALKALGIRLSMDDFGTGYSSLSYLRSFPFDGLKIDRSFVSRLGESEPDLAIVEAVIGLGKALSLTVTAEGIETLEQLQLLDSVACDEGQGYFLSRPMDAAQFAQWLRPGR